MWNEFALVLLVTLGVLLIPGYLSMRAIGAKGAWPVLLAPIVGLSLIAIVGQAFALIHIASTPLTLLGVVVSLPLLGLLLTRRRNLNLMLPRVEPWAFVLCLVLGIALGYNLFLSRLGTPYSLFQAYDVTQHLNLIQSMADSGTLTSLNVGPYLSAADQAIDPLGNTGFYPAAWHAVCALVVQITGCSVPLVINASMFALSCIAFPLSVLALVGVLFPESRTAHVCAALTSLTFVAFPWNLLAFGPVYANVAGFSLMPSAMALFVHMLSNGPSPAMRAHALRTCNFSRRPSALPPEHHLHVHCFSCPLLHLQNLRCMRRARLGNPAQDCLQRCVCRALRRVLGPLLSPARVPGDRDPCLAALLQVVPAGHQHTHALL